MGTRRIQVGCEFVYQAEIDTPAVFHVRPIGSAEITVEDERWLSKPEIAGPRTTPTSTAIPASAAMLPAGRSSFGYQRGGQGPGCHRGRGSRTRRSALPDDVPDDTLIYTMPSRYCLSDVLADEAWSRFGGLTPGYGRVQAICDYVHNHLTFQYGSSTPLSTAADVNLAGSGVCRDFTHLAISFCRALNIPARYVFGYLPDLDVPLDPTPWTSQPGWRFGSAIVGGPSIPAITSVARGVS